MDRDWKYNSSLIFKKNVYKTKFRYRNTHCQDREIPTLAEYYYNISRL